MNNLAKSEPKPAMVTVRHALEQMKPQFELALPKHLTPDRLLRVVMTCIQNTPKLLECDRTSLFSAVMTCAQLGLEPDGTLGQAYLIPFGKKVQFIIGYKGLISLARNSGEVSSISVKEVYENDFFEYEFGLNEKLKHIPSNFNGHGKITHFYAIAKFKDGSYHMEIMPKEEVDTIRNGSQGKNHTPWKNHYAEMGKKTVIRRMSKFLPMSVQKAAAIAESYDRGEVMNIDQNGEMITEAIEHKPEKQAPKAESNKLEKFASEIEAETETVT